MAGGDALAVATINATILAIFFAAAGLWVASVIDANRQTHDAETDVIEQANRINYAPQFPSAVQGDVKAVLDTYNPHDADDRTRLLTELTALISDESKPVEERAEKVWAGISAVLSSYPFLKRMGIRRQGDETVITVDEEHVPLITIDDVKTWLDDMRLTCLHLQMIFVIRSPLDELFLALEKQRGEDLNLFSEFIAEWEAQGPDLPPLEAEMLGMMKATMTLRTVPEALQQYYLVGCQIAGQTRGRLDTLNRMTQRRLPPRRKVIIASVIGAVAFASGVLAPMLLPSTARLFYAWVPAVCYAVLMAYGGVAVFRYGRPATEAKR
jgi:hypothetical protein